jgi:hypothetical protein
MNHKTDNHQNAHPLMDNQSTLISAENITEFLAPGGGDEKTAKPGSGLKDKRYHQKKVK